MELAELPQLHRDRLTAFKELQKQLKRLREIEPDLEKDKKELSYLQQRGFMQTEDARSLLASVQKRDAEYGALKAQCNRSKTLFLKYVAC